MTHPEAMGVEARGLVEKIAHKEQIGIWANEIATAISLGDFLKEDWSFDDSVDLDREITAQLRDILQSAFSHPEMDIAATISNLSTQVQRLTEERDALRKGKTAIALTALAADGQAQEAYEKLSAAEARIKALEKAQTEGVEHIETLSELLKIIKEHWIDYDHVFSIAVHEADQFAAARALSSTEGQRK